MKALALFFTLFLSAAWAGAEPLVTPDPACLCDPKATDPLEEPVHYNFGKFTGQCVDTCRFRRGRILKESAEELLVGNILQSNRFYRAPVRLHEAEKVEVGFQRFATGIDHVLLRFSFRTPLTLTRQDGASGTITTKTLVLSADGVPPKGHHYKLTEGFFGYYILVHRLQTGEDLEQWIASRHQRIRFVPLNLNGPRAASVLERGLQRADRESFQSAYQLFSNNCATSAVALLDSVTGYRKHGWMPALEDFEIALPVAAPFGTERALGYHGLTLEKP